MKFEIEAMIKDLTQAKENLEVYITTIYGDEKSDWLDVLINVEDDLAKVCIYKRGDGLVSEDEMEIVLENIQELKDCKVLV
jgi:hypothetical protein